MRICRLEELGFVRIYLEREGDTAQHGCWSEIEACLRRSLMRCNIIIWAVFWWTSSSSFGLIRWGQCPPRVYGAFICYKQNDMLHTVSYLKSALERGGIRTFVDFTLDGGVWFRPAINEAIEQSEIATVVAPQNFHFSAWCLNKLVKINKLMEKRNRRFAQTSTGRLQIFQYTQNN